MGTNHSILGKNIKIGTKLSKDMKYNLQVLQFCTASAEVNIKHMLKEQNF